jgi:hypothetical protein
MDIDFHRRFRAHNGDLQLEHLSHRHSDRALPCIADYQLLNPSDYSLLMKSSPPTSVGVTYSDTRLNGVVVSQSSTGKTLRFTQSTKQDTSNYNYHNFGHYPSS